MKHIVCFSGGESSALAAVEVFRKFKRENMVLLNHDIPGSVEDWDIKRFKRQVADYLSLPITYANYNGQRGYDTATPIANQFDVTIKAKAFKTGHDQVICTSRLKTEPFLAWLQDNAPPGTATIYYGFDKNEPDRIQRRATFLAYKGYRTAFPLAHWERTIFGIKELDIEPPITYSAFKHANCFGCLKAGRQHWYVIYCLKPEIWTRAKEAEHIIEHTILDDTSLEELEPLFKGMKCMGIVPTEHVPFQTFWAHVRKVMGPISISEGDNKPCECVT